jgi:uncharacterized protein (TIGR00288 family)
MNTFIGRSFMQPGAGAAAHVPRTNRSAALLIDFDNVTLGVHSDLGRELKALINSEVFRGKIAVRRAYADWRRFPNYVVPLTEASIDLIFAPAYGSSKKNTTDLRMSADAIELAFTRPEIDTFILLTGDSDFSSTVMKLKEYGKFVIGVGMRESSSDLIIQNCDEYFSYHALTGLTRSTAGEGMREDPWELVVRAAQKMASSGDAMRTDRLKQVMLSFDPGFNEKEIGYSKFSRFVSEADKKGLLRLNKLPDGQYEIVVDSAGRATPVGGVAGAEPRESRDGRERDGRRDRDRDRDRGRSRRRDGDREPRRAPGAGADGAPSVEAPETAPVEETPAMLPTAVSAAVEAVESAPAAAPDEAAGGAEVPLQQRALALLQRAVRALTSRAGESVRDGDVKRKMLDMEPGFDEGALGFSKFSRFLRHAHDHEAIDLERLEGGQYEVKLGSRKISGPSNFGEAPARGAGEGAAAAEAAAPAPAAASADAAPSAEATGTPRQAAPSLRGRRGRSSGAEAGPPPLLPGQVVRTAARSGTAPAARQPEAPAESAAPAPAEATAPATQTPDATEDAPGSAPTPATPAASEPVARRGRRGRRGHGTEAGPPPLLPGQVVGGRAAEVETPAPAAAEAAVAEPVEPSATTVETADADAQDTEAGRKRRRGGRGRGRKTGAEAGTAVEAPSAPAFSAAALGLPTDSAVLEDYLTRTYKGVGKKTVQPLLEAFGDDIFRVFAEQPDRVREVLGDKRAATVLEQWNADFERRTAEQADTEAAVPAAVPVTSDADEAEATEAAEAATDEQPARARRRGGRGRKRKADAPSAEFQTVEAPVAEVAPAAMEGDTSEAAAGDKPAKRSRGRPRGGRGRSKAPGKPTGGA